MDIKAQIQKDRIAALKAGEAEKKATLDYILGEIQKKEKDPAAKGDFATAVIVAYLKSLREFNDQHGAERPAQAEQYRREIAMLEAYLPRQLSGDEIRAAAKVLVDAGETRKGMVMKALKEQHGAALDGRRAMAVLEDLGLK
jgi:uncharacterized protein